MSFNLRSVDLNLLVIFEALVQERSVTRASARLGITPSAVSHALKRLRTTFKDELLIRTAKGMEPTPQAVKLAGTFHAALEQIETMLDVERGFNPATARRTFHLAISDYMGEFLIPRLCMHLHNTAPDVSLSVQYLDEHRPSFDAMQGGLGVHFSINSRPTVPVRLERVLEDRLLVIMRRGHPAAKKSMTLENYLSLSHIKVTGVGTSLIDETLASKGMMRRVMFKVPTWRGILEVIENTDLVAAAPAHWMKLSSFADRCVAFPMPVEGVTLAIDLSWHPRNDVDAGHQWFRQLVRDFFKDLSPSQTLER